MARRTHEQKLELMRMMITPEQEAAIDREIALEEKIQEQLPYAKIESLWSKTKFAREKARQRRAAADKS